ncbi:HpcH/HpaI aldolase family protein [Polymorphobacter fuscus]|uniref:HpcH/HpaI aldolase n=1 Tax=Sandarakinorhabdus fusca TaxID=1439888 RepID=A0A7C9KYV4_9SPHN|nr:aldolase/citrate lyase family protein [Polymorphobacter fuscus]KAB7643637.1 HpcH/HpaI aldolase [Polymorphobacter fuscus]MQT18722.1 HpcH/HpaI aldolase [Polymorphobacter fuscus]NJC09612.1 4-hydroxy-2-oxoheptanedioate aldolase [Polymorphobacter fuscus]
MNRIRSAWAKGDAAIIGWINIPAILSAEALARCGYDGLLVDLQHGAADMASAPALLLAIEHGGAEPMARVAANNAADIMRLLDFGATGIIAPMIDTAADAQAFADALHYPPRGQRSFGPRRPQMRFGPDYLAAASDSIVSLAMVETRAGLDNLDAILAVKGYDGIFIGPSDLALALGLSPRADNDDPALLAAIDHVIARCKAAGRRVGIYCTAPAHAVRMIAAGCDIVSIAPDLLMLTTAATAAVQATRAG